MSKFKDLEPIKTPVIFGKYPHGGLKIMDCGGRTICIYLNTSEKCVRSIAEQINQRAEIATAVYYKDDKFIFEYPAEAFASLGRVTL